MEKGCTLKGVYGETVEDSEDRSSWHAGIIF